MPTLRIHTHWQVAQSRPTSQDLSISVSVPTHGRQKSSSKLIEKKTEMNEHQAVTSCIVHLADSANFKGITSNKQCSGLTGSCFVMPNDTIHVTVMHHSRNSGQKRLRH